MNDNDNSIEQNIFSVKYTNHLFINMFESKKFDDYDMDTFPFEMSFPKGGTGIFIPENLELVMPDGRNNNDLSNAKIIFHTFRSLSPTQASDPRLWTYLTHVTFWDYMKKRWPVEGKNEKQKLNFIKERYFLRNKNLRTLTHNGISRLWWFGYLTFNDELANPWGLTDVLLKGQDLPTSLMERGLGANENIRNGVLTFFSENPGLLKSKSVKEIMKLLNLVGGVRNLPFLDSQEIKEILYEIAPAA